MTGNARTRMPAGDIQPGEQDLDDETRFEGEADDLGQDGGEGSRQAGQVNDASRQAAEGDPEDEDLDGQVDDDLSDFFPGQRQPARSETRIARLTRELRDREAEITRLRTGAPAQPAAAAAPSAAQVPGLESEAEFQARLVLMNPDDRVNAQMQRFRQESEHRDRVREWQTAQREQQTSMALDRERFADKAERDPRYKRWATKVEAKYQEFASQGQHVPREAVFRWLLGDRLLSEEGSKVATRQTQRGKQRVERQTVRPGNASSDVGGGRRQPTEAQARARRLEGVQI